MRTKDTAIIPEGYKRCSKCGEIKPISEFYKREKAKDGHQSWCKECINEYDRKKMQAMKASAPKAEASTLLQICSKDELINELNNRGLKVLVSPTPRDLMVELKRHGYEGTLTYTEVHTIDLASI